MIKVTVTKPAEGGTEGDLLYEGKMSDIALNLADGSLVFSGGAAPVQPPYVVTVNADDGR